MLDGGSSRVGRRDPRRTDLKGGAGVVGRGDGVRAWRQRGGGVLGNACAEGYAPQRYSPVLKSNAPSRRAVKLRRDGCDERLEAIRERICRLQAMYAMSLSHEGWLSRRLFQSIAGQLRRKDAAGQSSNCETSLTQSSSFNYVKDQ